MPFFQFCIRIRNQQKILAPILTYLKKKIIFQYDNSFPSTPRCPGCREIADYRHLEHQGIIDYRCPGHWGVVFWQLTDFSKTSSHCYSFKSNNLSKIIVNLSFTIQIHWVHDFKNFLNILFFCDSKMPRSLFKMYITP